MSVVQQMQNDLIEDVHDKLRYFIELKWSNNMGSIHVYTKKINYLKQYWNCLLITPNIGKKHIQ